MVAQKRVTDKGKVENDGQKDCLLGQSFMRLQSIHLLRHTRWKLKGGVLDREFAGDEAWEE